MAKKLYVGNLPFKTTNDDLMQLFSQFGQVEEANVIMDKFSGRSRGFGFVSMANDDEAKAAIDALDGKEHEGRELKVNEARPPRERGPQQ